MLKDRLGRRGLKETLETSGRRVRKAFKGWLVLKGRRGLKETPGMLGRRACKAFKGQLGRRALRG